MHLSQCIFMHLILHYSTQAPSGLDFAAFLPYFCVSVQVYKEEDVSGEVIIELDVTWAGQQNVQLVIKPFPKFHLGVGLGVGKLISNFLTMRVGVGNLFFSGRVWLSLRPLMGRLPVVGAVRVSFVEQPHFNYALTVYGGDISFLPGKLTYEDCLYKGHLILHKMLHMLQEKRSAIIYSRRARARV